MNFLIFACILTYFHTLFMHFCYYSRVFKIFSCMFFEFFVQNQMKSYQILTKCYVFFWLPNKVGSSQCPSPCRSRGQECIFAFCAVSPGQLFRSTLVGLALLPTSALAHARGAFRNEHSSFGLSSNYPSSS